MKKEVQLFRSKMDGAGFVGRTFVPYLRACLAIPVTKTFEV